MYAVTGMYTTIVSTDRLASHLEARLKGDTTESDWAIVDCRFDLQDEQWGHAQYQLAHVPGALYASLNADLSAVPTGSNGRHPLPAIDALAATFGRLGLDRGTQVVAYDQDAGSYASRLWWLLRYLGHDAVAVLDGGWAKWVRERRPAHAGDESRPAKTYTPSPRPQLLVDLGNVIAHLEDPARVLIDARAAERFEGRRETIDRVAGHIPGARNHFFKQNLHGDGTMLPPDTLRATFQQALAGHTPADAVMYCGSGVTACQNLLAMEHAGLTGTKLYVGSWSEWSSDPSRAIETGPAKRS
jgi:thiosulfate/3-mercaptopyruvate sulfurtransferase